MIILPVLDLQGGLVVRGVGGRRQEYQPAISCLTSSAAPLEVAEAFRQQLGLNELYLADLDAIAGGLAALELYAALQARGFKLWVDAGLGTAAQAADLAECGVDSLIAGLETLAGPAELTALCQQYGSSRIVFSLDLKGGQPVARSASWSSTEPRGLAEQALACGVRRLILLDLARVGLNSGTGTEELCMALNSAHAGLEVTAGGGVRGLDDLRHLQRCGAHAVLVASALHDGRLQRRDLEEFR